MKKLCVAPEVEIIKLENTDIITSSGPIDLVDAIDSFEEGSSTPQDDINIQVGSGQ